MMESTATNSEAADLRDKYSESLQFLDMPELLIILVRDNMRASRLRRANSCENPFNPPHMRGGLQKAFYLR